MAKMATKRKSEDASENPRKHKATSSKRYDVAFNDPQSSSEGLFVDQPAPVYVKKSRSRAQRAAAVRRLDDEYEEDEGRMESQQFLALVEMQTRKKNMATKSASDFTDKFENSIQNEERNMRERVQRLGRAIAIEDNNFIDTFTRAYSASRPTEPLTSQLAQDKCAISDIYFSTLYPHSRHLVTIARSIISQFDTASEMTAKLEVNSGLLNTPWEDEIDSMRQLMRIGRQVGLEKFDSMLDGVDGPDITEEDGQFISMLYTDWEDIDMERGMPWGKLVKRQFKAGKRLYKTSVRTGMSG